MTASSTLSTLITHTLSASQHLNNEEAALPASKTYQVLGLFTAAALYVSLLYYIAKREEIDTTLTAKKERVKETLCDFWKTLKNHLPTKHNDLANEETRLIV